MSKRLYKTDSGQPDHVIVDFLYLFYLAWIASRFGLVPLPIFNVYLHL